MDVLLTFVVPSDPRILAMVRGAVGNLGELCGLTGTDCRRIVLAVDEAMANVIRHAYHGKGDGVIELRCAARTDRLDFVLLDEGEAPDPARLSGRPVWIEALGGRGIHIIRTVMDEVCYERVARGNQLRMSKHLPAASTAAGSGECV